jgi:hypothetical protein
MTSRRGRGEDSVYLDGDRWRGAASLGYGPNGHLSDDGLTGAVDVQRAADPIANGSEVAARRPASSRATVMTS